MSYFLPTPPPPTADPAQLQEALRRRREEMTAAAQPAAETKAEKPKKRKRMPTYRTKLEPQELAHVEALIRRNATDDELADWRKEREIHHKTFAAVVRGIRQRVEAPPSPMAAQLADLESAPAPAPTAPAPAAEEPPAVIVPTTAPARPAQIEPVIQWLSTIRAMREELAQHGVTVAGNLRIEIEL